MPRPPNPLDIDDAAKRYQAGEPLHQLARQLHVSPRTLLRRLKDAGIEIRSQADAMRLNWAKVPADSKADRLRNFAGSQRGIRRAMASKIKQADSTRGQIRGRDVPKHEVELLRCLSAIGVYGLHQHPIGPYTVDIAFEERSIAIEVQRGHWGLNMKPGRTLHVQRLEYILDAGWSLLVVYCPPLRKSRNGQTGLIRERFNGGAVAYKLLALLNVPGTFPPGGGQYGVIDGYGQPAPIVRLNLHGRPVIPSL